MTTLASRRYGMFEGLGSLVCVGYYQLYKILQQKARKAGMHSAVSRVQLIQAWLGNNGGRTSRLGESECA